MRSTYYGRPIPEYAYSTIVYKDKSYWGDWMILGYFMSKPAIKIGNSPPSYTLSLWFDTTAGALKYYNPNTQNWELVQDTALIESIARSIARKEAIQKSIALGD